MIRSDVYLAAFLGACALIPFRVGVMGTKTIDLKTRDENTFCEPTIQNCGPFTYWAYTRIDNSRVCSSIAPHLVRHRYHGITARPVEFKF